MKFVYVGIGGCIGALLRYVIGGFMHEIFNKTWLPVGTFTVNMVGCFFIGLLMGLAESRQMLTPEVRLFIVTGLLGSLTTFSTFAYESSGLLRDGEVLLALSNIGLHVIMGLVAVYGGHMLSQVL